MTRAARQKGRIRRTLTEPDDGPMTILFSRHFPAQLNDRLRVLAALRRCTKENVLNSVVRLGLPRVEALTPGFAEKKVVGEK